MQQISNNFWVGAIFNGTTINGVLRSTLPLVQRYTEGTNSFAPDFEVMAENAKPVIYPFLRLTNTGEIKAPSVYEWYYNDVKLTFNAAGLCTNAGMVGVLKMVDHTLVVGSTNYIVPGLRLEKNLVPISNYDNDIVYISGSVEIAGTQVPFEKLDKTIVIEQSTGNRYDLLLTSNKDFGFTTENESMTITADIYKDSSQVTDFSGFTMKWSKVTGDGETVINGVTGKTLTLTTNDVNGTLVIKCDLIQNGAVLATAYETVYDYSDPYNLEMTYAGNQKLSPGETVTITPKVVDKNGSTVSGYSSFKFAIRDNAGNPYKLTNYASTEFTGSNCKVTYDDVIAAQRSINGYVTTTN